MFGAKLEFEGFEDGLVQAATVVVLPSQTDRKVTTDDDGRPVAAIARSLQASADKKTRFTAATATR